MSLPHDYVLLEICGELDDAVKTAKETWARYCTEKAPVIRRFHIEQHLAARARIRTLMHKLVDIRED